MADVVRLIDANALLEDFGEEPMVWLGCEAEIQERNDWRRYKGIVESQPTVDAVEVVHGQNISPMHPVDEFHCSKCGLLLRDWSEVRIDEDELDEGYYEFEFKYCPNCGAKMD